MYIITVYAKENYAAVLEAYKRWKTECADHLYCEFSFVIYDSDTAQYFAARDAVGTRPLYYAIYNNIFYFSDDIGEIFSKSGMKKEPDLDNMRSMLAHTSLPYDATLYKKIKRLPPGHTLSVDKEMQIKIVRYWKPETIQINETINDAEVKERFLALYRQAIADRIDSFENTVFDLSGGLDSSSNTCLAKQIFTDKRIRSLSQNYSSLPLCDESEYIDAVLGKYDLDHIKVELDTLDYKEAYSLAYNYRLNPYWPILVTYTTTLHIAKILQANGITRLITGQGGDQLMGGSPYVLYDYFRRFEWRQLSKELKASQKPFSAIKSFILLPLIGEKNKNRLKKIYASLKFNRSQSNTNSIEKKQNIQSVCDDISTDSLAFWHDIDALTNPITSLMFDASAYHTISKHFGINAFHPFYDRRVMEFVLSLPSKYKFSEGWTKKVLRSAMDGVLPNKILQRKDKAEFTPVIKQQIDAIDLKALFHDSCLVKQGLIEQKEIEGLIERYNRGEMERVAHFWKIINMEFWYQFNFTDIHPED